MEERRVFACRPGCEEALTGELGRVFPAGRHQGVAEGFVQSMLDETEAAATPHVAFSQQCLPAAVDVEAESIQALGRAAADVLRPRLSTHDGPWRLHAFCQDYRGSPVRQARADRVRDVVVKELGRLTKAMAKEAGTSWCEGEWLGQVALVKPSRATVSLADAETLGRLRGVVSRFPGGNVVIAEDKRPPSRAHMKLREALVHMDTPIRPAETCVDLGASPGGWTWVAIEMGARVIAVDRSVLRADLARHKRVECVLADAFEWEPATRVDWLLCDVIAFPERTVTLLRHWARSRLCRRFCVTVKFKGDEDHGRLEEVKGVLRAHAKSFVVRQLCNNKNEVTVFGIVKD